MKKSLVALAALAAVAAHAQSSVQMYGLIDQGIASQQHSIAGNSLFPFTLDPVDPALAAKGSVTSMVSGGESMSRFGFKGTEDLGGGVNAMFLLEGALGNSGQLANAGATVAQNGSSNTTSTNGGSSINGQLFSRGAYVGLGSKTWGSIQLGRTTALALDQVAEHDPLNASGLYSPLGFSGALGGGLGATENARMDNSIKYQVMTGPVKLGLQYKIGDKKSSEADNLGSIVEGMIGYTAGPLSITGTYSQADNTVGLGGGNVNGASSLRVENVKGGLLSAKYEVNSVASISGGFEQYTISTPSNAVASQITSYYGTTIAGSGLPSASNYGFGNQKVTTAFVGGAYKFTPEFTLKAGYYNINKAAYLNAAGTANQAAQYTIQEFSLLGSYAFSKMTDVYGGLMFSNYNGAYMTAHPTYATSNSIVGAGLRVKF